MAYCKNCGAQIDDQAMVCPRCGASTLAPGQGFPGARGSDTGSVGWGILGFCIPLVGLILFLVWKDDKPQSAKMAGIGALVSVVVGVVFTIIGSIMGVGLLSALASYY